MPVDQFPQNALKMEDMKEKKLRQTKPVLDRQYKRGLNITWTNTKGCSGLDK